MIRAIQYNFKEFDINSNKYFPKKDFGDVKSLVFYHAYLNRFQIAVSMIEKNTRMRNDISKLRSKIEILLIDLSNLLRKCHLKKLIDPLSSQDIANHINGHIRSFLGSFTERIPMQSVVEYNILENLVNFLMLVEGRVFVLGNMRKN